MDGNRFDALTRSLVGPRRMALRALAGAALGAVLAAPRRIGGVAADPRSRGGERAAAARRRPGPTCRVEEKANTLTTTFTVKLKRQKLTLTVITRRPRQSGEAQVRTTTMRRGRTLLLRIEETFTALDRFTVRAVYGAGFTGIAAAIFTVDGGTVRGDVDGRAIVPFPAGTTPDTLAFEDGQPAPEMTVSERTAQHIEQILARARAQPPNCGPVARRTTGDRDRPLQTANHSSPECEDCQEPCITEELACGVANMAVCQELLLVPIVGGALALACIVEGAGVCERRFDDCLRACRVSPVCNCPPCGYAFCCHSGGPCLSESESVCCSAGDTVCQGTCCPAGGCTAGGCCSFPNAPCGNACCGPLESCCNGGCCGSGQTCCGGACCNGTCINNTCCPAPNQNCGGVCCGRNCCNNVCCRRGESCDPGTGACAVRCNPDFGERACPTTDPRYPACCPALFTCCTNGECCGPGLECCAGVGGGYCATSCEA